MRPIRLVPERPDFKIIDKRRFAYVFSALLVLGALALMGGRGLNFGIDFAGGTLMEIEKPADATLAELRTQLSDLPGIEGDPHLQSFSASGVGAEPNVLIRLQQQPGGREAQEAATERLRAALGPDVELLRTEYVGPVVGGELKRDASLAVLFSLIGILIYIWYRFEWQFGLAAVIALLHDAVTTLGLFALTQMQFNLSTVAALLMIAGYSINDTVVMFDRVRENLRRYKTRSLEGVLNLAINDTLSRTLMTSLTTLLALGALWLFGGEVIRGFAIALIWGVVIGTYSSTFVAVPALLMMRVKRSHVIGEETEAAAAGPA